MTYDEEMAMESSKLTDIESYYREFAHLKGPHPMDFNDVQFELFCKQTKEHNDKVRLVMNSEKHTNNKA